MIHWGDAVGLVAWYLKDGYDFGVQAMGQAGMALQGSKHCPGDEREEVAVFLGGIS